jgi:putative FmdB family regulatory protein
MPTYEYRCKQCDDTFDVVQSFNDEPLTTCSACGGPLRKVFGNIGISFKGSGFYRTDSRNGNGSKKQRSEAAGSSTSSGSGESGSTSGSDGGSDSTGAGSGSADSSKSSGSKEPSQSGSSSATTAPV